MRRKLENGEEKELEGYRMKLFDYSGKNILTISKYDQKLKEEFDRVKKTKTDVPLVGSKPIDQLLQQSMKRTTFPVYVVWERKQ